MLQYVTTLGKGSEEEKRQIIHFWWIKGGGSTFEEKKCFKRKLFNIVIAKNSTFQRENLYYCLI